MNASVSDILNIAAIAAYEAIPEEPAGPARGRRRVSVARPPPRPPAGPRPGPRQRLTAAAARRDVRC